MMHHGSAPDPPVALWIFRGSAENRCRRIDVLTDDEVQGLLEASDEKPRRLDVQAHAAQPVIVDLDLRWR
jgi:hypothetical protein